MGLSASPAIGEILDNTISATNNKINVNSTINVPENAESGIRVIINGALTDESGKKVSGVNLNVNVGDETYSVTTDSNGHWYLYNFYTPKVFGDLPVIVSLTGHKLYSDFTNSTTINIDKIITNSTINVPEYALVGENTNIYGILSGFSNPVGVKLNITINNMTYYTFVDNDGKWSLDYTPTISGNHTVTVRIKGYPPSYYDFTNTTTLTVHDNRINANSTIVINDKNIYETHKCNISGTLKDEHGKKVPNTKLNLSINDKLYHIVTDKYGDWSLNNVPMKRNTSKIEISLKNNPYFMDFTNTTEYNFMPTEKSDVNSTINIQSPTIVGKSSNISGTLKDEHGEAVPILELIITINNEKYTVTTDKNGEWSHNYTPETDGNHTITVSLTSNEEFNDFKNSTYLSPIKTRINTTINVLNNPTVNKQTTIQGTLKDEHGKKVPNTKLNLSINGKDYYTVTTNNYGDWSLDYTLTQSSNYVSVSLTNHNYYYDFLNTTSFNTKIPIDSTIEYEKKYDTCKRVKSIKIYGTVTDYGGNKISNLDLNLTLTDQYFGESKKYKVKTNDNGYWEVKDIKFDFKPISPQLWHFTISLKGHPKYQDFSNYVVVYIEK